MEQINYNGITYSLLSADIYDDKMDAQHLRYFRDKETDTTITILAELGWAAREDESAYDDVAIKRSFMKRFIDEDVSNAVNIKVLNYKLIKEGIPGRHHPVIATFLVTFDLSEFLKSPLYARAEYKRSPEMEELLAQDKKK